MSSQSPIMFKIIDIKQIEVYFSINTKFFEVKSEKNKPITIVSDLDISFKVNKKVVDVVLSISSEKEDQPFIFKIKYEGLFEFEKKLKKEEIEKIVHINCAAIIFPYVRESIADLTRRAGVSPLHLNPVNFVHLYEVSKKKQQNSKNISDNA